MSTDPTSASQELRTRIGFSATLALCGVVLSVTDLQAVGGWLTVGSLAVLLVSLHRYGRQGPDNA